MQFFSNLFIGLNISEHLQKFFKLVANKNTIASNVIINLQQRHPYGN